MPATRPVARFGISLAGGDRRLRAIVTLSLVFALIGLLVVDAIDPTYEVPAPFFALVGTLALAVWEIKPPWQNKNGG